MNTSRCAAPAAVADDPCAVQGPGRYDLVIGSDLLHERDERGSLAAFIDDHAQAASEVWIVDPNRGNRSAFNRHMAGHGFTLLDEALRTAATPGRAAYRGRLLSYRRGRPA